MHDEDQRPLQAVEDDEEVQRNLSYFLIEEETAENPHASQNTQLSHRRHREASDGAEFGEVWVEAGEFLSQFPHGDDKNQAVEADDEADGREEAPDEVIFEREPTVSVCAVSLWEGDGRDGDDD